MGHQPVQLARLDVGGGKGFGDDFAQAVTATLKTSFPFMYM